MGFGEKLKNARLALNHGLLAKGIANRLVQRLAAVLHIYDALARQYGEANARLAELYAALRERQGRRTELLAYLNLLEGTGDLVTEFGERLWSLTLDAVTVLENMLLCAWTRQGSADIMDRSQRRGALPRAAHLFALK